jgi:hypothetical protein
VLPAPAVGPLPGPADGQAAAPQRSTDARLARVHLRGGLLPLARATLEQMAGVGELDVVAMADLAESRWRSGDLEGAADAARAHQASGGAEPLAALILAEDLARTGQLAEARRFSEYVAARVGAAVEQLFAAETRSTLWPPVDEGWMAQGAEAPGRLGLLVGGSEVAASTPETWIEAPLIVHAEAAATGPGDDLAVPMGRGTPTALSGPHSTAALVVSGRLAGEELERVDRALAVGDIHAAATRLAVLLRLDPALAPVILSVAERVTAAESRPGRTVTAGDRSAVHLLRGDAYRMLGRENEAAAAYRLAHQALSTGPTQEDHP